MATQPSVTMDTLITIKVALEGSNRRFKIPLKDLGANVLENKLRAGLAIPTNQKVVFERFSDSAGAYVILDPSNTQVYKTLFRAAKAKLKLRLKATIVTKNDTASPAAVETNPTVGTNTSLPLDLNGMSLSLKQARPCEPEAPSTTAATEAIEDKKQVSRPQSYVTSGLQTQLAFRAKDTTVASPSCAWSVYCNQCDKPMSNEYFHCSICDDGDYDLCVTCNETGFHCRDASHWLVKRFVQNGQVVNSTSERVAPQVSAPAPTGQKIHIQEKQPTVMQTDLLSRTCNSCINILPESEFVTCKDCEDYDLCIPCHVAARHGHHPGHTFIPATKETMIGPLAEFLCSAGRNVRHAAVCDGCDKYIYGIRHKCLHCPDWDYCSKCVKAARFNHPSHRFVPIYDPLPEPRSMPVRHHGIFCDGPLCKDRKSGEYIEGVRYKCAVCNDTDFCANCEAAPCNRHNRTHPLLKFKTPVRNVSVTTMGEDRQGSAMTIMGDHKASGTRRSASTETVTVPSTNAATQVQTVIDFKPREVPILKQEQANMNDLLAEPIQEKDQVQNLMTTSLTQAPSVETIDSLELVAHFVRDTVPDGTKILPGALFTQVWTLQNPGPHPWPAGCSVRYVGGDNMLNVDDNHPSSATEINEATESNVIQRLVQVGEEVSFRVLMKAPKRQGIAISYWRLKAMDGTPFGHRLWCHIDSTSNTPAKATSSTKSGNPSHPDSRFYSPQQQLLTHHQQLLKLQAQAIKRRQEAEDEQQKSRQQEATLIEANLKRHAEVRAEAIESMRRAAELMDAELERSSPYTVEEKPPVKVATEYAKSFEQRGSMIFPQLDKESPISSLHEAVTALQSHASTEQIETETIQSPSVQSDVDFFEDAETIEYSETSDEGFATDEEYEILDASDHELH
ncbi:hypothetical protein EJ05DRAFT_475638 [Pseudovirgaria hyperparasitica]|uniref:ZZ-type domain-containing protein n=1 Tax=Pseudovirgaria hyperparasitica TaxID=470096 RepID=A0A6A6WB07_9PEZI|nr:uncharacterized protein EJ05DRAFT_475638 [Pseudovirgaria hyperparasitica]KAF2758311.1 hypothetical protein EJ05DRAFT_475638 [Pseudovirgaria hyperparasitica]